LNSFNKEIIIGYSDGQESNILKIFISEYENIKDKTIVVSVFDEQNFPVNNVIVYSNSEKYETDQMGHAHIIINEGGKYVIYAEKTNYIRSEKNSITIVWIL